MHILRSLIALCIALAPALSFAQVKEPFKFGLVMPLTGSQALYGKDQVQAAQWAVDDINKAGGVNGRKLEMVLLDSQADPQIGINMVNRLVSVDKVQVFVTAWSGVVKAVAPIANREKVLALSIGASSPDVATLGDYMYTAYPLADVDIVAVANYSYQKMGKRKAAVLYINNDTGVDSAKVYRAVFEKQGGQIVAYEAYDAKAPDYSGALLKVRAANPDVIHIQGLVSDIPQVIAQMRQLGITVPVSSYSAAYNPALIQKLGAAAEGLIATSLAPGEKDSPKVAEYVQRWQKDAGRVPNGLPYTQYLYDAPYLVAALFKAVDDRKEAATGENLRKALIAGKPFDLPMTGMLEVRADHTVKKPVWLMVVKGGQYQLLDIVK
jgi:branched-chain amino acid transport system substrate-binding protein